MANIESFKSLDDDGLPTPKSAALGGKRSYRRLRQYLAAYMAIFSNNLSCKAITHRLRRPFAGSGRTEIPWSQAEIYV